MLFGSIGFANPENNSLYIHPYLQNVTQHSIVIMWETTTPAKGIVEYGLSPDQLDRSSQESTPNKIHEITLDNLKPGSTYFYRCRWNDESTRVWHFKTAPTAQAKHVRIAAYGDSRSNPQVHRKIAELIAQEHPDLILHSGDIVVDGRKLELWKPQFFDPIQPFAPEIPLLSVLGNHERNAIYYYKFYSLNNNEAWWSTDYGPVHIIGLDSNQPGDPGSDQYNWLVQDLENHKDAKWKIVMFHHPLFNAHPDRPVSPLRWVWHPLFEKYGVDLVISGHDHYYARTLQIGQAAEGQRGVTYIVSAGGGASVYPTAPKEYTAYRQSIHHFTLLDFDGDELVGRAIDTSGKVFDTFAINKTAIVSPEEFVSYEMMVLKNTIEDEMARLSINTRAYNTLEIVGNLALPVAFKIPVIAHINWRVPASWTFSAGDSLQKLAPGDTLFIRFSGTVVKNKQYPMPSLSITINGDNEKWTPPRPTLGFKNSHIDINIEDALFQSAMRSANKAGSPDAGLYFVKDFPQSRYTPRILSNFWRMAANVKNKQTVIGYFRQAINKIKDPSKKALFYPPLFLLGDLTGWNDWLRLAEKADYNDLKAMAPNLLALLRSGNVKGGLVKNWTIIGPFDNTNDEGYYRVYPPEQHIDLQATYTGANGQPIRWQQASPNKKEYLDFTKIFKDNEVGIVYAMTRVNAKKDAIIPLLLGSNDAAVVWVNGKEIYRVHQHRGAKPGDDLIFANFKKGENTILVKVDQVGGAWGLYVHMVDKEGQLKF